MRYLAAVVVLGLSGLVGHAAARSSKEGLSLAPCRAGQAVRPSWVMRRWGRYIAASSHKYRVNPALIAAIITRESHGDARAWNHRTDARGLMQVRHGPWSPRANIDRGTGLFVAYYQQFGSLSLALAAYNAGPNNVARYHGIPPFAETLSYVPAVTTLYVRYHCAPLHIRQKGRL
jgi:soluble lytic murein transglycosylase-like protein